MAGMKCPVCDVDLSISSREGVEIDFCPQCRGVWLDRGELDKIIDRAGSLGAPAPAPAPEPARQSRDEYRRDDHSRDDYRRDDYDRGEYGRKKKKRGGFLEDLFDFD